MPWGTNQLSFFIELFTSGSRVCVMAVHDFEPKYIFADGLYGITLPLFGQWQRKGGGGGGGRGEEGVILLHVAGNLVIILKY